MWSSLSILVCRGATQLLAATTADFGVLYFLFIPFVIDVMRSEQICLSSQLALTAGADARIAGLKSKKRLLH